MTALSAQPSPGGQGDALKALDDLAAFCSDDTATVDRHVAVIRAALDARQPVRSSTVSDDMMDVVDRLGSEHDEVDPRAWDHMLIYAPTEKLAARLAARQPVTMDDALAAGDGTLHGAIDHWQERALRAEAALSARLPVGISADWVLGYLNTDAPEESREAIRNAFAEYAALSGASQPVGEPVFRERPTHNAYRGSFSGPCRCWADADHAVGNEVMRYAAPPAQAVDLGKFRDLAEFALRNAKLHNCWEKREALARDLLALIDSKAVGK